MNISEISEQATILIVDDDLTNLDVLLESLHEAGFRVLIAEDGEDALQQADLAQPDLLLLDVLMPGLDGFETCRRLQHQESTRGIPVIFMTALADADSKLKGFEAGGVDYVTKPLEHHEVLARIMAHLTIQRQQKLLQASNASKDKFFSIIAHDLRGPLTSLDEISQMLEENFESYSHDRLKQLISLQRQSTDNLCKLLENLLTWSRIQRGMIEYNPRHIDLKNVVMWNIKLFKPKAEHKHIILCHSLQHPILVYADLLMVDTIIRNVTSNALKFTQPEGTIFISACHNASEVEISVSDTGIGIKQDKLTKLFRIDTQYKRPGTSGEKGTGLGLILCKEFVQKQQGRIWVESEPGQGTTVRFTLPTEPRAVQFSKRS